MFIRPEFCLEIDGAVINTDRIKDISLYNSIDSTLPELTFKISDEQGDFINELNLYVGCRVKVILIDKVEYENPDPKIAPVGMSFCEFSITRVYDGFESNKGFSGYIQVWCIQAWRVYGNYNGIAFPPQKISDTIKEICKSTNELASIRFDEDAIKTSSDTGSSPRFKCAESDLEFIENKLLPYTNIDSSNVFFYVDLFGTVHLTSFNAISSKKESVIVAAPKMQLTKQESDLMEQVMNDKQIDFPYFYSRINVNIGNEDIRKQLEQIKRKCLLYNNSTGKSYIGYQEPSVAMGKQSDKNFANKIPFNTFKIEAMDATGSEVYPNRTFDDALAMAFNKDVYLEDIFLSKIIVDGIVDEAKVGETLYLLPKLRVLQGEGLSDEDKKKVINWMSGKWVIKSIKYTMVERDACNTEIEIIRPTFIFNSDTTTISKPRSFYGI